MKSKQAGKIRQRQLLLDDADLSDFGRAPARDEGSQARPGRTVETDVTRVLYSGLVMRPVFELDSRRLRQGDSEDFIEAWTELDVIWLAFAVLDVVSELTQYETGATRQDVIEALLPHARRQAEAKQKRFDDHALSEVLHRVFDHLVNRERRYLPFEYSYYDAEAGLFRTRRFWLVKNVYTGEKGPPLFTLTDEGYTAYFGLLETGALDAAAIGNLRIRMLVERGNVDEAIQVARQNRKQCSRKSHEVYKERRKIRNNIRLVDFDRLMALADEGADRAVEIQKDSGRLHCMVSENLVNSQNEYGTSRLHVLADMLADLNRQLIKLSGELQQLPDDYHRHAYKLFAKRSTGVFPRAEEVLRRVCRMAESDAARAGERFLAGFDPPMLRPIFDPAGTILSCDRALERRTTPGDRRQPFQEIDGGAVERFEPELTTELMDCAFSEIAAEVAKAGEMALSQLLKTAIEKNDPLLPVAVAMAVFQAAVDVRMGRKHGFLVKIAMPESHFRYRVKQRVWRCRFE